MSLKIIIGGTYERVQLAPHIRNMDVLVIDTAKELQNFDQINVEKMRLVPGKNHLPPQFPIKAFRKGGPDGASMVETYAAAAFAEKLPEHTDQLKKFLTNVTTLVKISGSGGGTRNGYGEQESKIIDSYYTGRRIEIYPIDPAINSEKQMSALLSEMTSPAKYGRAELHVFARKFETKLDIIRLTEGEWDEIAAEVANVKGNVKGDFFIVLLKPLTLNHRDIAHALATQVFNEMGNRLVHGKAGLTALQIDNLDSELDRMLNQTIKAVLDPPISHSDITEMISQSDEDTLDSIVMKSARQLESYLQRIKRLALELGTQRINEKVSKYVRASEDTSAQLKSKLSGDETWMTLRRKSSRLHARFFRYIGIPTRATLGLRSALRREISYRLLGKFDQFLRNMLLSDLGSANGIEEPTLHLRYCKERTVLEDFLIEAMTKHSDPLMALEQEILRQMPALMRGPLRTQIVKQLEYDYVLEDKPRNTSGMILKTSFDSNQFDWLRASLQIDPAHASMRQTERDVTKILLYTLVDDICRTLPEIGTMVEQEERADKESFNRKEDRAKYARTWAEVFRMQFRQSIGVSRQRAVELILMAILVPGAIKVKRKKSTSIELVQNGGKVSFESFDDLTSNLPISSEVFIHRTFWNDVFAKDPVGTKDELLRIAKYHGNGQADRFSAIKGFAGKTETKEALDTLIEKCKQALKLT